METLSTNRPLYTNRRERKFPSGDFQVLVALVSCVRGGVWLTVLFSIFPLISDICFFCSSFFTLSDGLSSTARVHLSRVRECVGGQIPHITYEYRLKMYAVLSVECANQDSRKWKRRCIVRMITLAALWSVSIIVCVSAPPHCPVTDVAV